MNTRVFPGRSRVRSVLALPPVLRPSCMRHANLPHHGSLVRSRTISTDLPGLLASVPASLMTSLNAAGLPWWSVIPMSAFIIRTVVVVPFFQLPYRKAVAKLNLLDPLIGAKLSLKRRQWINTASRGWSPQLFRMSLYIERWSIRSAIGKQFGVKWVWFKRLGGFAVLMVVIEGIRRLCGSRDGLLTILLGPVVPAYEFILSRFLIAKRGLDRLSAASQRPQVFDSLTGTFKSFGAALGGNGSAESIDSKASGLDNKVELQKQAIESVQGPGSSAPKVFDSLTGTHKSFGAAIGVGGSAESIEPKVSDTDNMVEIQEQAIDITQGADLDTRSSWFQPSLRTGGFSWCPDLTKHDPSLILPFLFSTSFFALIFFAPRVAPTSAGPSKTPSANGAANNTGDGESHKPATMERASMTAVNSSPLTNMQRILLMVAVLSVFPALKMPSAMLIYYISNIGVAAFYTRILSHMYPIRVPPSACSRPVRMHLLQTKTSHPLPQKPIRQR